MKKAVFVVLMAAAVALAVKSEGAGPLPAVPCSPTTTSMGPARSADADPRLAVIRAEQAQAAARGDEALARKLESTAQAIYLERQPAPGSADGAIRLASRRGRTSFSLPDMLIDSGTVWATATDYEMDGTMWVAYSRSVPDTSIDVVRSTDHGTTWEWVQGFFMIPTTIVNRLGLVVGPGDSGFVYVFTVHPNNDGDMLCTRFNKDGSSFLNFWVHASADTINNFKVCRDYRGDDYWLYCVAGDDDRSPEMDDFFLRSTDYGKTWATLRTWRFVSDGSLTAGAGSYLYMAGRPGFSPANGQLNMLVNRFWGHPDSWSEAIVAPDTFTVMDPVMVPSFVSPPESAVVWVLYSHDYNGTDDWDMQYLYSTDAGSTWSGAEFLAGESDADERFGDIKPYTDPGNPWMNASYISEESYRTVFRHYCNQATPTSWSDTLRINSNSAGTGEAVRPLLVYSPGAAGTGAGCVFVGEGLQNVYFNSPWLTGVAEQTRTGPDAGFSMAPNPVGEAVRFTLPRVAGSRLVVCDVAGREIVRLAADGDVSWNRVDALGNRAPAGVYIVRLVSPEKSAAQRLVLR